MILSEAMSLFLNLYFVENYGEKNTVFYTESKFQYLMGFVVWGLFIFVCLGFGFWFLWGFFVSCVLIFLTWYFKYYIYESLNIILKKYRNFSSTLTCKGKFF